MNPLQKPHDVREYFRTIAADLGLDFGFGNSERILNRQSSQIEYPLLWLEVPEIDHQRSGGLHRRFDCALAILTNVAIDDVAGQDEASDETFELAERVLRRLAADSETEHAFIFDADGCRMEKKEKWSADDDWGWRVSFTLIGAACEDLDCCE